MTMDFFLIEEFREYDRHDGAQGEIVLPVRDRRPTDPGFVLTWKEHRTADGPPVKRTGVVLGCAPPPRSVWVVPDDPQPGEGYAVLVREVVASNAAEAVRQVGGPGDFASTAAWQSPRSLPRALLRVDTINSGGTVGPRPVAYLHAHGDCPEPTPFPAMNITVQRGIPTPAEKCYVFGDHLHPASVRLTMLDVQGGLNPYIQPCGLCLKPGRPV